jgi:hypothetical protein
MDDKERIEKLEDEIIELKYQLKQSKDKELVYKDILFNIEVAIKTLFKREKESERFNLGEVFDFRECVVNLKNALDEYKRLYNLRF